MVVASLMLFLGRDLALTSILRNYWETPPPRFQISTTPAADRSFGKTINKWDQQIGLDTAFNIVKEFWPDVRSKLFGH